MSLHNAPPTTWLGTARLGPVNTVFSASDGDLWPSCWAADDAVYTAWGDGRGFDLDAEFVDVGTARIVGDLGSLQGENRAKADDVCQLWTAPGYTRKPTGIVCVGNRLHLAVQDLAWDFRDAPAATICTSDDGGASWQWDRRGPMFDDHVFTTLWFADFGRGGALSTDSDEHVYVYGLDGNWRASYGAVADPVDVFLARVHRDDVADRAAWEFFCGVDAAPAWTASIDARSPILHDDRRVYTRGFGSVPAPNATVIAQGGVLYDRALGRYLYVSWAEWVHVLYESPTPWGPWRRAFVKDYTARNDQAVQYGGYGTSLPSKFVSPDGRTLMLQSNRCCGIPDPVPSYCFSMRPLELAPRRPSDDARLADDRHEPDLLRSPDAVLISKSVRQGTLAALVDDDPSSHVDDDDGEAKDVSWWGAQWPEPRAVNRVRFTTGPATESGGWFASVPRVEILDTGWHEAPGQVALAAFTPGPDSAGQMCTIDFIPLTCYGVRIVGASGGDRRYTSMTALSASWELAAVRDPGFEQSREPWGTWIFEGGVPRGIESDPQLARSGRRCASLNPQPSAGRHGIAQTVGLPPGHEVEVGAWVRAAGDVTSVYVGLRLAGADAVRSVAPGSDDYEYVSLRLTVPADCTTGEVVVGMDAGADGARLLVDDVDVRQLPDHSGGRRHA